MIEKIIFSRNDILSNSIRFYQRLVRGSGYLALIVFFTFAVFNQGDPLTVKSEIRAIENNLRFYSSMATEMFRKNPKLRYVTKHLIEQEFYPYIVVSVHNESYDDLFIDNNSQTVSVISRFSVISIKCIK